jgi:hypothetical protein
MHVSESRGGFFDPLVNPERAHGGPATRHLPVQVQNTGVSQGGASPDGKGKGKSTGSRVGKKA